MLQSFHYLYRSDNVENMTLKIGKRKIRKV